MANHYFEQVYDVVRMIPVGRVSTYGAIANYLTLGSARMTGWALKHCMNSDAFLPAHRVVNSKGELSGRHQFSTPTMMEDLLREEGVEVKDAKVVDFKKLFWNPSVELED